MYIPLRGCCTDSPGCDDIATVRQIYLTLAVVFGAAVAAIGILNVLYR
jgi:hypothetical protein